MSVDKDFPIKYMEGDSLGFKKRWKIALMGKEYFHFKSLLELKFAFEKNFFKKLNWLNWINLLTKKFQIDLSLKNNFIPIPVIF